MLSYRNSIILNKSQILFVKSSNLASLIYEAQSTCQRGTTKLQKLFSEYINMYNFVFFRFCIFITSIRLSFNIFLLFSLQHLKMWVVRFVYSCDQQCKSQVPGNISSTPQFYHVFQQIKDKMILILAISEKISNVHIDFVHVSLHLTTFKVCKAIQ